MGSVAGLPGDEMRLTGEGFSLALEILGLARKDLQKESLLAEISQSLARFSGCDSVEIRLVESGHH